MIPKTLKLIALTAVLSVFFVLLSGETRSHAQMPKPLSPEIVASSSPGRFQIVNGTPDLARNIMLLDTVTGDSWITCRSDIGNPVGHSYADGWCPLPKFTGYTSSTQ